MSGKNRTSPVKIGPLVHSDMSRKYGTGLNLFIPEQLFLSVVFVSHGSILSFCLFHFFSSCQYINQVEDKLDYGDMEHLAMSGFLLMHHLPLVSCQFFVYISTSPGGVLGRQIGSIRPNFENISLFLSDNFLCCIILRNFQHFRNTR